MPPAHSSPLKKGLQSSTLAKLVKSTSQIQLQVQVQVQVQQVKLLTYCRLKGRLRPSVNTRTGKKTPGGAGTHTSTVPRAPVSVSQSVISRSRPALTPPPARSPAPPLPVEHKYRVLAPGGYSMSRVSFSLCPGSPRCLFTGTVPGTEYRYLYRTGTAVPVGAPTAVDILASFPPVRGLVFGSTACGGSREVGVLLAQAASSRRLQPSVSGAPRLAPAPCSTRGPS